jgi:hypothetical protein
MEPGFVVDKGHYSMPNEQEWLEGEPVKSFWLGLKTKGRERHPVRTYRCERCGYLESYAIQG